MGKKNIVNIVKQESKSKNAKGKATYRARIRESGVKLSRTFQTNAEAQEWALQIKRAIKSGNYMAAQADIVTLEDLINLYIDRVLSKKSQGHRENLLNHFMWWNLNYGRYKLETFNTAVVSSAKEQLLTETIEPRRSRSGNGFHGDRPVRRASSTVRAYLNSLHTVFEVARKEWQIVNINPVSNCSKPRRPKSRERWLTKDERERLYSAAKASESPYIFLLIDISLTTGCRKGELLNLRKRDVSLEKGTITFTVTKSDETRTVPITDLVVQSLARLIGPEVNDEDYVFSSRDGKQPANIDSAWRRIQKLSGLKDFRWHDMRHDFCTRMARNGVSSHRIRAMVGHKTLAMAERYSHVNAGELKDVFDAQNKGYSDKYYD